MGFNFFEKIDRARQLRKSKEDSRKRAEVFEELADPKTGALANRFFELSKGLVSVGTFGEGVESEEYKKILVENHHTKKIMKKGRLENLWK